MKFLKEGAAATYGSDAIAGVVNFITDKDFEGLRVNFAAKRIPNAQGEVMNFLLLMELSLNDGDYKFSTFIGASQHKPEFYSKDTDYTKYQTLF